MQLEFELVAIIPDTDSPGVYTVYLFNAREKLLIPFSTNKWASESILIAKQNIHQSRPHVHNTMMRVTLALGATLNGILIYKFLDEVFYAYLQLEKKGTALEIDAKVSDAICLAFLFKKPIYIAEDVYRAAGIKITRDLIEKSLDF